VRRIEIMRTRACDLGLTVEASAYRRVVERVAADLARRGLAWMPEVYLSTGWHCPDRVPVIGVPFTLATAELRRLDREVTKYLETTDEMAALLRHEVGHCYNYALGLHETKEWREAFGPFSSPYRDAYAPARRSRQYVRHLANHYAQKHPDEDFAETFAVWLAPRSGWRRRYEGWGAMAKLRYVDRVMREAAGWKPAPVRGPKIEPIEEVELTVAQHYRRLGYRIDSYGFEEEAVGFFDDDIAEVFRGRRVGGPLPASAALRRLRRRIVDRVIAMLHVRPGAAEQLYDKYVERAEAMGLETGRDAEERLLVGVTTMMTTHLLNRKHTGRFTRTPRVVRCR
jgi:hypothetical protein